MGNEPGKPEPYVPPDLEEGEYEIRVNVYKLKGIGGMVGGYHSAIAIFPKEEWSFGACEKGTGVYRCNSEGNTQYSFYKRHIVGRFKLDMGQFRSLIRRLMAEWPGNSYNLTERNCNHFSSELLWNLVKRRPPEYINELSENLCRSSQQSKMAGEHWQEFSAEHEKKLVDAEHSLRDVEDCYRSLWGAAMVREKKRLEADKKKAEASGNSSKPFDRVAWVDQWYSNAYAAIEKGITVDAVRERLKQVHAERITENMKNASLANHEADEDV
mmetsp:Transcript_39385/g.76504  ORF Transcript_39385/g.76504 Transcript_39385/m.76504 type:complete len:270 (+) Transcript_39385:45-854(+)